MTDAQRIEELESAVRRSMEQLRSANENTLEARLARRLLPRYWFTRLYVALSVLTSVTITIAEPTTLAHRLILQRSGDAGWLSLVMLGTIAFLALVDVLVNDGLPARYVLPTFKRRRHMVYMALAVGLVSLSYVIASRSGYSHLLWSYWIDAAAASMVAFLDLFSRHREGRKC